MLLLICHAHVFFVSHTDKDSLRGAWSTSLIPLALHLIIHLITQVQSVVYDPPPALIL